MNKVDLKTKNLGDQVRTFEVVADTLYKFYEDLDKVDSLTGLNLKFNYKKSATKTKIDIRYVFRDFSTEKDQNESQKLTIKVVLRAPKKITDTVAILEIRVINLSSSANILIEPILEIEEKNVEIDHKVTIGGVDPGQIQYLRSRGIDESEAKDLIIKGFLDKNKPDT